MLSTAEQTVLAQCSVFAGSFDLPAAEAILEVEGDDDRSVLDLLHALRDRSLLSTVDEPSGDRRMVMLASVRAFVAPLLGAADRSRAESAHAAHYLAVIGASPANDAASGRKRIAVERGNLLAVRERALSRGDVRGGLRATIALAGLASSMSYGWSLGLIEEALAPGGFAEDDALVGWAYEARGSLLRFLGQTRRSLEVLEQARTIAERSGDRALAARVLIGLGNGAANLARWSAAHEAFEGAIRILDERGDRFFAGRVRTMVAAACYNEDRLDEASAHLEAALALQREQQDRSFEAMSMTSVGIVALARGAHANATAALDEALAVHQSLGDRHWEAVTVGYQGALALDAGELERAKTLLESASRVLGELGVHRAEAIVLGHLGHTATLRGSYDEALVHYRAALGWHRLASPDYEGLILGAIGSLAALRGEIASALASFDAAEQALAAYSRPTFVTALALGRALVDVASAEQAFAARDPDAVAACEGRARAVLHAAEDPRRSGSPDARAARRILEGALERLAAMQRSAARMESKDALVAHPDGLWFRAPLATSITRLNKRPSLQRMFRALVERRAARAREGMTVAELLECGWPGEKVLPEAGQERVYTAIATLRRMGLRTVIVRKDEGYLLAPDVDVVSSLVEP
jgi:tetratricopeptide (TPR) repeat protein